MKTLDIDKDERVINAALRELNKTQHQDLKDLNDPKLILKDFEKLHLGKGMTSISQNRYKNKELFAYGQLMDKDVPIFTRAPRCSIIIGFEN